MTVTRFAWREWFRSEIRQRSREYKYMGLAGGLFLACDLSLRFLPAPFGVLAGVFFVVLGWRFCFASLALAWRRNFGEIQPPPPTEQPSISPATGNDNGY